MAQSHQKHIHYAQEGQRSKRLHDFPTKKHMEETLYNSVCIAFWANLTILFPFSYCKMEDKVSDQLWLVGYTCTLSSVSLPWPLFA